MIEFRGNLNNNCRQYLLKRLQKITAIGAICIFLLVGIPSLLAWIYFDIWIFFIMVIAGILLMFILTKGIQSEACPIRIVIDLNEVYGEYRKGAASRSVDDVKQVIDQGEFYHILFYFPNQWSNCICQKNLIVEGTIEEFEKLFEDKIVRKYEI